MDEKGAVAVTIITILSVVFGYGLIGGVTYQLTEASYDDEFPAVFSSLFWPIGLPFYLGVAFIRLLSDPPDAD